LEPVVGANGVLIPPPEYWPMVRDACDDDGALLIADEVLTGFGRTGRCFAIEHFGVVPDIITVAKGITGGYAPLGAVLVHERVAERFDDRVLPCGLTNYAHPLSCAAGVAALDVYREDGLFDRANALGPVLRAGLEAAVGAVNADARVRSIGLLAAEELELAPAQWQRLQAELAARLLFMHVYPDRGTIIMAPPLCIDEATLRDGIDLFAGALSCGTNNFVAPRVGA